MRNGISTHIPLCVYYVCPCVCKMWEWHNKGLKSLTSIGKESEELIFFFSLKGTAMLIQLSILGVLFLIKGKIWELQVSGVQYFQILQALLESRKRK